MNRLTCLLAALGVLTIVGCQSTPQPMSNQQKILAGLKEVKATHDNRATASCSSLDAAMAKGYSVSRLFTDERVAKGTPSKKSELLGLQFEIYYDEMEQEFRKRCEGEPVVTNAMKNSYNDIVRQAVARREKTKGN